MRKREKPERRDRAMVMVFLMVLGAGLIVIATTSLESTMTRSTAERVQRAAFLASQIAESAAARALAQMKDGGIITPKSGTGSIASWVTFGNGDYYYDTTYDPGTEISTIRAWGRISVSDTPSKSNDAPDSVTWDGSGWFVRGLEISLLGVYFMPESPMYFGNGGVERPMGGFAWTGGSDPADPSTWGIVTSGPSSWQTGGVPFESSALDHPVDYNYAGGTPAPATSNPHPYKIWTSQNPIGQHNVEAWYKNSAGSGYDPTSNVTPPPTSAYYDTSDKNSPDYPYPVNPSMPDVQDFSWALWNKYGTSTDPNVRQLSGGNLSGSYGDLANPGITFVTGGLNVAAGKTFEGAGVLVIRDNYNPNTQSDNEPAKKSDLTVNGTFKWTGLVIVAGWAPTVYVRNPGNATIVGSLFGEDSVQSGGEISLDSATIILQANGPLRVLFSSALFDKGGMVRSLMPPVGREIIAIRSL